jgi:hypothetical protein
MVYPREGMHKTRRIPQTIRTTLVVDLSVARWTLAALSCWVDIKAPEIKSESVVCITNNVTYFEREEEWEPTKHVF